MKKKVPEVKTVEDGEAIVPVKADEGLTEETFTGLTEAIIMALKTDPALREAILKVIPVQQPPEPQLPEPMIVPKHSKQRTYAIKRLKIAEYDRAINAEEKVLPITEEQIRAEMEIMEQEKNEQANQQDAE